MYLNARRWSVLPKHVACVEGNNEIWCGLRESVFTLHIPDKPVQQAAHVFQLV